MKDKKRKLSMVLLSVVLLAIIAIGATLAYFTDEDEAENIIVLGHVDIDLKEPNFPGGPDGGTIEDVMPGDEVPKDPTVSLDGASQDAYVRMKMMVEISGLPSKYYEEENEGLYEEAIYELMSGIDIQEGWYPGEDGYYYYNRKLTQDDRQTVLFTKVEIPRKWGNDFSDCRIDITLQAEAIQADNFEPVWDAEHEYIILWLQDGNPVITEKYEKK